MKFIVKSFEELNTSELYEILKARAQIFIMEQNINYQDMDDIDYKALHMFYIEDGYILAYLRAFYKEESQDTVQVGRVLTIEHGKGLGKELLKNSLEAIKINMHPKKIVMDAQKHAITFYEQFGFKVTSDEFLEEGIMHVKMELDL